MKVDDGRVPTIQGLDAITCFMGHPSDRRVSMSLHQVPLFLPCLYLEDITRCMTGSGPPACQEPPLLARVRIHLCHPEDPGLVKSSVALSNQDMESCVIAGFSEEDSTGDKKEMGL